MEGTEPAVTPLGRVALAALLLAPAAVRAAAPSGGLYRESGDWTLTCDNAHGCVAKALADPAADAAATSDNVDVQLRRDAGPTGTLRLAIVVSGNGAAVWLDLDGRALSPGPAWAKADCDQCEEATISGGAALGMLRRMAAARTLTITGRSGPVAHVSLRGLGAALALADAVQGRRGTVTAFVRPGPAPAATVPPPPALPVYRPAPSPPPLPDGATLANAVRRLQAPALAAAGCTATPGEQSDATEPLTARNALVVLTCDVGAYQSDGLGFVVPRAGPARAQLLALPLPPGLPDQESPSALQTGLSYDPHRGLLFASAKGSGAADCGISAVWVFDGTAFRLASFYFQSRCGGLFPGDWPTLVRSRRPDGRPFGE